MSYTRDTKLLKQFGAHLRNLREANKLTLEQLANKADVEVSQIHRIESGKVNTTISTLNVLAKALGIRLKELIDF